eukprot:CAMPEP_0182463436 /NCGR_PEP_ID=MMETSP1319-20130603/7342_1 /TAXON_ID=172717 /ORGANISM="Bolidomonas pacifica, Strain RCC208" /LENGTH=288 /DNA_ID=CAMNT_0024662973 /DNA_START=205 /DNA_END=1067 /DNA_ORIENTATION=+
MSSSPSKPFPHRSPRLPLLFLLSSLSFVSLFRRVPAYGALLHDFTSSFPRPLDFAPAWVLSPPSLSLSSSLLLISPLLLLLLKRYLLPPLLLTLRRLLTSRILPSLYSRFLPPPETPLTAVVLPHLPLLRSSLPPLALASASSLLACSPLPYPFRLTSSEVRALASLASADFDVTVGTALRPMLPGYGRRNTARDGRENGDLVIQQRAPFADADDDDDDGGGGRGRGSPTQRAAAASLSSSPMSDFWRKAAWDRLVYVLSAFCRQALTWENAASASCAVAVVAAGRGG